jgi:hypothetical protein
MDVKKTPDLSHWDFAEQFFGWDAAALILGVEPRESEDDELRVRVVYDRLEEEYEKTRNDLFEDVIFWNESFEQYTLPKLMSVKMEELYDSARLRKNIETFRDWLNNSRQAQFQNQKFSRKALAEWLRSIKMVSVYSFSGDNSKSHSASSTRWPWGSYHTELLGHLEATALRFWVNYDPADATTAETNATVSEWLQAERKVSKTMADAIASILRPDGLPTGPRK